MFSNIDKLSKEYEIKKEEFNAIQEKEDKKKIHNLECGNVNFNLFNPTPTATYNCEEIRKYQIGYLRNRSSQKIIKFYLRFILVLMILILVFQIFYQILFEKTQYYNDRELTKPAKWWHPFLQIFIGIKPLYFKKPEENIPSDCEPDSYGYECNKESVSGFSIFIPFLFTLITIPSVLTLLVNPFSRVTARNKKLLEYP